MMPEDEPLKKKVGSNAVKVNKLLYYITPRSDVNQHWWYDVLPKFVQAIPFLMEEASLQIALDSLREHQIIPMYYKKFGMGERLITVTKEGIKANKVFTSCNCLTWHPLISQFGNRLILSSGWDEKPAKQRVYQPLEKRKYIVYGPRKGAARGRPVPDEEKLIEEMMQWTSKCTIYQFRSFGDMYSEEKPVEEYLDVFSETAAIFGAHGGFFANGFFCFNETLVIEGLCDNRKWFHDTFYAAAAMLEQKYIRIRPVCHGGETTILTAQHFISVLYEYLPPSAFKQECYEKRPTFDMPVTHF